MVKTKSNLGRRRLEKTTAATSGQASGGSNEERSCWNDLPEFYCEIFSPDVCFTRMRIPPAFLVKFGENIPTNVTLRMPSGGSWQVHLLQISEHWFFEKGWPKFVLENSVEERDLLIFTYVSESIFLVKVFASDYCRKGIGSCSMLDKEPVENTQGEEASEPENDDNDVDDGATGRKTGARNPSFTVKLKQYVIDKSCTYIPAAFWKAHMKNSTNATLWIKEKSWVVSVASTKNKRHRFGKGWLEFSRDNSIKHGNICTFQLMDSDELSLSVTICR